VPVRVVVPLAPSLFWAVNTPLELMEPVNVVLKFDDVLRVVPVREPLLAICMVTVPVPEGPPVAGTHGPDQLPTNFASEEVLLLFGEDEEPDPPHPTKTAVTIITKHMTMSFFIDSPFLCF